MKKRVISLLLTVVMTCAMLTPAQAAETGFSDVSARHYAGDAIAFWTERGVLGGYPDGTFRPGGSMTRAEMAVMLQNVMGYMDRAENVWTDLPQKAWYTDSILALASRGVLSGTGKGKMSPKTTITRQEAFVMLSNALGIEPQEGAPGFADNSQIASWAVGYVTALKNLGYIHGYAGANTIRPTASITRAETVVLLSQLVPGYVSENGVYSASCPGNLLIKAGDVKLKDMTVEGDLIVTEAVGEGDVYLEGVTVKGDIVLYGCGENSFHLLPGCKVDKIIVTKTTGGRIRVVNESGETIPLIWVNDGTAGVTLDGDHLGEVVVACDAPVAVKAKTVGTLSVTGNANLTVSKESTVASLEVASTAGGAKVNVEGKVTALVNDGGASVVGAATGRPNSGSGSGSSGGSSGGGSVVTPPAQKTTLNEVSIQLKAPAFGDKVDTKAEELGTGFSTKIQWFNADGSAPSYRWKVNSGDKDTFTANQAYKAVVTLIPTSTHEFSNDLQVSVVDGNGGTFTPAASEKKGNNWEITLTYPATEAREYLQGLTVEGNWQKQMTRGEAYPLRAIWTDNLLIDPSGHVCKWYTCDDANGSNPVEISGATGADYTIPGDTALGMHYYLYKVTAGGKEYTSNVVTMEVQPSLTADDVPTPQIEEARMWMDGGELRFEMRISNVLRHADLEYRIEPIMVEMESEFYHPTFNMWFDSEDRGGCNVEWGENGTLRVSGTMMNAYSWKEIFEEIERRTGQTQTTGESGKPIMESVEYVHALVRVIPSLKTEYGSEGLTDKVAEQQVEAPWTIHYVVGSRTELADELKKQPEVQQDPVLKAAVAAYPKDNIVLVVDDLDNNEYGRAHLAVMEEQEDGSKVYNRQVTDPDVSGEYGIQCYFRTYHSGWIAPSGDWSGAAGGWNFYFWSYLKEWMDNTTDMTQIKPEMYFCYQPDVYNNPREFYVYRVIPGLGTNYGN